MRTQQISEPHGREAPTPSQMGLLSDSGLRLKLHSRRSGGRYGNVGVREHERHRGAHVERDDGHGASG